MPKQGWSKKCLLGWLLAWTLPAALAANDTRPLSLERLTTEDGLPQGTVYDTLQDSKGFVWLATEDGLIRYDGHDLVRYAHSRKNRGGLPGNFIRQIVEDQDSNLWITIKDSGLVRWNRATDQFTTYRHDPANKNSLASNLVKALLIDSRGRIWIGLPEAGIDILDPKTGRFEHLRKNPSRSDRLIDDRVNVLAMDRSGAIWAGTESGLSRFRDQGPSAEQIPMPGGPVSQILEDRNGRLWVGTMNGGLMEISNSGKLLRQWRHDATQPTSLIDNDVRAILEDSKGRLWIGTALGLDLLDAARNEFSHYQHRNDDASSLSDSYIMSLYEDYTGLVWIGTRAGGVNRWNPHSWELGGHRPSWLAGTLVTSFADATDGRVWVGSIGGGLVRFDPATGSSMHIDQVIARKNALNESRVMSLLLDRRGTLWIGTMSNGLKALRPNGQIVSLPVGAGRIDGTSAAGLMTLYESRDGNIWIGTYGGGANVLDPATGVVRQLPYGGGGPGALSGANVSAFAQDAAGNMWIATDGGGLNLTHADGRLIRSFLHDSADLRSLSSNTIYALTADGNGRIWIGTEGGGLDQVVGDSSQPQAIQFNNLSRVDGLSSDTVYGVLTDPSGRLWLSGNAGLTRFDPASRQIKTYHREHGLQGEEFNFNAYFRSRGGLLLFGGPGGFNAFDPGKLTEQSTPPRVVLTQLEIQGAPVASAKPWWLVNRIDAAADANIIALDFATLDYKSPRRNRLAYRMRGLSDRWIELGTQHRVTLTNLDAGEHLLEVRAANADSVWSEIPYTLIIHKAASFWRSPLAYFCYACLLALAFGYRIWLQRRKFAESMRAQQRLESEVASRTQELRESNRLLEEAARVKQGFLARMSHELRTPMNGVIGMADLLETTPLSATQHRYTNTIRSSANTLLHILNDLLDISKINAGKILLETAPIDLAQLIEESALLFSGACKQKDLQLHVRPPELGPLRLMGDALRIRQILMNLIGNAVKFTQRGSITVQADITLDSAHRALACIDVTDTGIGIDPKAIQQIFEPFTQADETTARRFGGTGLGLTICRELAGLMGGSIRVDSEPGVGTSFRVTLPLDVATGAAADVAGASESTPAPESAELRGHVLIVEDDPINATVAEGYLRSLGCSCVWVTDGPSAFARIGVETFQLILMDINMPGMDGFATTTALRQAMSGKARVPIIALTAHDAAAYRTRCLAADMDDILSKPYTLTECSTVLRRWLPAKAQVETISTNELASVDASCVAQIANLSSSRQSDLFSRLVRLYEQSAAERLAELATAITANDGVRGAAVCHKLKSASANVGALAFANVVRQTEAYCLAGEVAHATRLHQSLTEALPDLLANLRSQQVRVSA